jgi:hypothetical protein
MSLSVRKLLDLIPFRSCYPDYQALSKKEGHDPVEEAKSWAQAISNYPELNHGDLQTNDARVQEVAGKIIQSLRNIYINSSNEPIIDEQLRKVCMKSDKLNESLRSCLSSLKGDKNAINDLRASLILTMAPPAKN